MTYEQDPTRWTSSPDEAPELLRGAFSAARNEGPNQTQMRSLAMKIAAVSAGGAVAIGAAKATSTAQAAASAATWSIGKMAGVIALAGGIATGAVIWKESGQSTAQHAAPARVERTVAETSRALPPDEVEQAAAKASVEVPTAPVPAASSQTQRTTLPSAPPAASAVATSQPAERPEATRNRAAAPAVSPSAERRAVIVSAEPHNSADGAAPSARNASASSRKRATISVAPSTSREQSGSMSEVELLRRAQVALRGRPREAFQLTEQHRQQYPHGEFAQERDALAIQALIGAGETEMARDLAIAFIKAHPSSPHAHRFREAMGIR